MACRIMAREEEICWLCRTMEPSVLADGVAAHRTKEASDLVDAVAAQLLITKNGKLAVAAAADKARAMAPNWPRGTRVEPARPRTVTLLITPVQYTTYILPNS